MTDHPYDHHRTEDEIVSAVLDGEATADDLARVESVPALRARLAQFRAVADRVAGPSGLPPPGVLDRLRADALESVGPEAGTLPVQPPALLAARRRRARRVDLPSPAMAAAVLLVLALIGFGLVVLGGSDRSNDLSASGSADSTAAREIEAPAATSDPGPGVAEDRTTAPAPESLGTFADQAELTEKLGELGASSLRPRGADGAPLTTTERSASPSTNAADETAPVAGRTPDAMAIDRCDDAIRNVPGLRLGERTAVATAVLDDRKVLVYSHPQQGSDQSIATTTLLTVADVESCRILFAVQR